MSLLSCNVWLTQYLFPFQLILNDNSQTALARYRHAKLGIVSRSRRAFLEVLPAGLNVVDLVVVTFVSFMKQRMTIDYWPVST